jgi:hypothetical protein
MKGSFRTPQSLATTTRLNGMLTSMVVYFMRALHNIHYHQSNNNSSSSNSSISGGNGYAWSSVDGSNSTDDTVRDSSCNNSLHHSSDTKNRHLNDMDERLVMPCLKGNEMKKVFEGMFNLLQTVANAMMLNELEVCIWSIYIERLTPQGWPWCISSGLPLSSMPTLPQPSSTATTPTRHAAAGSSGGDRDDDSGKRIPILGRSGRGGSAGLSSDILANHLVGYLAQ